MAEVPVSGVQRGMNTTTIDVSPAACTARLALRIAIEWCREYARAIDDAVGHDEVAAAFARYSVAVEVLQDAFAAVRATEKKTP